MKKSIKNKNNKYLKKLTDFICHKSQEGRKTIEIKQRKRLENESFWIHPVFKGDRLSGINTERRSLKNDTLFPIEIFETVIDSLIEADNNSLNIGTAQKPRIRIGHKGLEVSTIESIIAIKVYNAKPGDSVTRRSHVVANILKAAGICNYENGKLVLIQV